jgi:hypothetical protein
MASRPAPAARTRRIYLRAQSRGGPISDFRIMAGRAHRSTTTRITTRSPYTHSRSHRCRSTRPPQAPRSGPASLPTRWERRRSSVATAVSSKRESQPPRYTILSEPQPTLGLVGRNWSKCPNSALPEQHGRSSLHRDRAATGVNRRRIVIPSGRRSADPEPSQSKRRGRLAGRPSSSSDYPVECARRCSAPGDLAETV